MVALFGQLADAFDDSTWIAVFAVAFGSPLFGALMRVWVQGSFRGGFWGSLVIYYGVLLVIVPAGVMFGTDDIARVFYLLLLAGPILGLTLCVTARRNKQRKLAWFQSMPQFTLKRLFGFTALVAAELSFLTFIIGPRIRTYVHSEWAGTLILVWIVFGAFLGWLIFRRSRRAAEAACLGAMAHFAIAMVGLFNLQ